MILEASDREQRIIGQELHDGVCQELAGIAFLMQSMQRKITSTGRIDVTEAVEVTQMLCKAVSHARGLSHGLYPVAPESNGLSVALQRLADDTADAHGVRCTFRDLTQAALKLNAFVATNIFRIAQELVRIAIHAANASEIEITVGHSNRAIHLIVTDDGLSPARARTRRTDAAMLIAHRAQIMGATLSRTINPERGMRVVCELPLEFCQPEESNHGDHQETY